MLKQEHIDFLKNLSQHTDRLYSLKLQIEYLKNIPTSELLHVNFKKIVWVTVNPKPDISLESFKARVDNYLKRKFVLNPLYRYEQRGETEEELGRGFHVHILFDKSDQISPAQIIKYTQNSFKYITGNSKHIDIKIYPYEYRKEKEDYLNGIKWDKEKEEKLKIDKLFREKNGLNI